ncbi:MAG: glycyl-radical enzyme activating protein [Terriglobia bacterium]
MYTKTNPDRERSGASTDCRGLIFNIMRFCLHDGPGTRTTVFFKGCPLCCWWCHNPEGRSAKPDLMFFEGRCVLCEECLNACPHGAIVQEDGVMRTTDACRACGTCMDVCAAGARELAGHWMTVGEVLDEIEKDRLFWDESGGGVTFSGGEPFFQPHFLESLLDACRVRNIHTAIETCGYAKRDLLLRLSGKVDLFLFDLKLLDSQKHRANTGRSNEPILANLRALAQDGRDVIVRYPVIPEVNSDEENVKQMITLLRSLGLGRIHLLPFHPIGAAKYRRLRLPSPLAAPGRETENDGSLTSLVEHIAQEFSGHGFEVRIGG